MQMKMEMEMKMKMKMEMKMEMEMRMKMRMTSEDMVEQLISKGRWHRWRHRQRGGAAQPCALRVAGVSTVGGGG